MDNIKIRDRGLYSEYLSDTKHKDVLYFATDTLQLLLNGSVYGGEGANNLIVVTAIEINDEVSSNGELYFKLSLKDYEKAYAGDINNELVIVFEAPVTENEFSHLRCHFSHQENSNKVWIIDDQRLLNILKQAKLVIPEATSSVYCSINFSDTKSHSNLEDLQRLINSEAEEILSSWTPKEGSDITKNSNDITEAIYDLDRYVWDTEEYINDRIDDVEIILEDSISDINDKLGTINNPYIIEIPLIPYTMENVPTLWQELDEAYHLNRPIFVEVITDELSGSSVMYRAEAFDCQQEYLSVFYASALKLLYLLSIHSIKVEPSSNNIIFSVSSSKLDEIKNKVDKVDGYGLSQEDFTTAYKDKLDELIEGKVLIDLAFSTTARAKFQEVLGLLTPNDTAYTLNEKVYIIHSLDKCEFKVTSLEYVGGNWIVRGASTVHLLGNRFFELFNYTQSSNELVVGIHEISKNSIGLENVDNTSDEDKPVSNATNTLITLSISGLSLSYDSNTKEIVLKDKNNIKVATLDATLFIKDGMVDSVEIENDKLVITFNTESGKDPIALPLSKFVNIYEGEKAITIDDTNRLIKLKISPDSTDYLKLGENGLLFDDSSLQTRFDGINDDIDYKVSGPSNSVNNNIAVFDGASGKIIKDGGKTINELTTSIANKVSKAGDTMTGELKVPILALGESAFYDDGSKVLSPTAANDGLVSLGRLGARWANVYSNTINVSSTDLVSNLNADLLDNKHVSSLIPSTVYNFTNGCLVRTTIPANTDLMIFAEIKGNSYDHKTVPFDTTVLFYNYNSSNKITNYSVINKGPSFKDVTVFNYDNKVYLWFKQTANFQTFIVNVYCTTISGNCVETITNAAIPSSGVTRSVTITPRDSSVVNFTTGFGGSQTACTTNEFIDKLKEYGAFDYKEWQMKCSWNWSANWIITDTSCGNILLAGATIKLYRASDDLYTIVIYTSPAANVPTGSNIATPITNAVFIYRYNGSGYPHPWKRLANADELSSYVKKSGDTMVGDLTIQGGLDTKLILNNTDGELYSKISFRENGEEYASIIGNKDEFEFLQKPVFISNGLSLGTTALASNLNADLLDGYHASTTAGASVIPVTDTNSMLKVKSIFKEPYVSAPATAGWYRIYTSGGNNAGGFNNILLNIGRNYGQSNNEHYSFSVSVSTLKVDITQLSGQYNILLIPQIRVLSKFNSIWYIDLYYSGTRGESVYIDGIGHGVFLAPTLSNNIPEGYGVTEFETTNGFKASVLGNDEFEQLTPLINSVNVDDIKISGNYLLPVQHTGSLYYPTLLQVNNLGTNIRQTHINTITGEIKIRRTSDDNTSWLGWTTLYDLNNAKKLTAEQLTNKDLNTIKDNSFSSYFALADNSCTNKPTNVTSFGLLCYRTSYSCWCQILTDYNASTVYIRHCNQDTWTSWKKMITEDNLATSTTNGLMLSSDKDKLDSIIRYTDNLLLNTDLTVINSTYLIKRYNLAETPVVGQTYTFTLWGKLASTKTQFDIYNSGGAVYLTPLTEIATGVYSASFTWKNVDGRYTANDTFINIYAYTSSQSGTSTIYEVKLEKGTNTNPKWSPSASERKANYDSFHKLKEGLQQVCDDNSETSVLIPVDGTSYDVSYDTDSVLVNAETPVLALDIDDSQITYSESDSTNSTFNINSATPTTAGVMTASDKVRLDGIQSYSPNLLLGTGNYITATLEFRLDTLHAGYISGDLVTISYEYEYSNVSTGSTENSRRFGMEPVFTTSMGKVYLDACVYLPANSSGLSGSGKKVETVTIPYNVTAFPTKHSVYIQVSGGSVLVRNIKMELGKNTNPIWTPALSEMITAENEDVQFTHMFKSGFLSLVTGEHTYSLVLKTNEQWSVELTNDDINITCDYSELSYDVEPDGSLSYYEGNRNLGIEMCIHPATSTKSGVMSPEDKKKLDFQNSVWVLQVSLNIPMNYSTVVINTALLAQPSFDRDTYIPGTWIRVLYINNTTSYKSITIPLCNTVGGTVNNVTSTGNSVSFSVDPSLTKELLISMNSNNIIQAIVVY